MGEAADPRENHHFYLYMMKKETVSACLYGFFLAKYTCVFDIFYLIAWSLWVYVSNHIYTRRPNKKMGCRPFFF